MFGKISSIITTRSSTPAPPLPASHHAPSRAVRYVDLASRLSEAGVPVDQSDCATCDLPCPPDSDAGTGPEVIWGGRSYEEYVLDRYGELGSLPEGIDTDWESELAGSATGGTGRVVVISTGKSDWERDHTDEKDGFAHQLYKHIQSLPPGTFARPEKEPYDPRPQPISAFILPASLPPPSTPTSSGQIRESPSLYSSSLISQSDNPSDQTVLVFPDWKVVHEVENSREGARGLYEGSLEGGLGRAGRVVGGKAEGQDGVGRRRSWVLPYRAVVLLCSHKRRDNRCHIAAPLLRSALHTCLSAHSISIDETGSSLSHLTEPPLETLSGSEAERQAEVAHRISSIESIEGGDGGEVGVFNINHLGGHRYAGVMLIFFPSGAHLSYGRLTPQEIPRVVEETILKGRVVPGLLRNAVGVSRAEGEKKGCGFLGW